MYLCFLVYPFLNIDRKPQNSFHNLLIVNNLQFEKYRPRNQPVLEFICGCFRADGPERNTNIFQFLSPSL